MNLKISKKLLALLISSPVLFSFQSVEKTANSVTVLKDNMEIKVEIVDDAIIHVNKQIKGTPKSTIPDFVTVLEPQKVDWKMKENDKNISIETSKMKVLINNDGTIEYQNSKGKQLVSETNEKTFISTKEEYAVSQSFSVGDEALYGLGQYQSGIMNWKHVPMKMAQFNQEAVVPFLVSTKNYGIYWNNYSITYFNPTEHEIVFEDKAVIDAEVIDLSNPDVEDVSKSKTKKSSSKNIRTTTFVPAKTGQYTFFVKSDVKKRMRGHISLIMNGQVVINYSTVWVPTCYSGKINLEAGKEYEVVFRNDRSSIAGSVTYNEPDYNKTVFSSKVGSSIDYYMLAGDKPEDLIALNHKLTGKTPMFEKKAYGFWQCRERYSTQEELLENAREMRERKIPYDMIVQDWYYWPEKTKGPEWDRAKYPDPAAMAKEVHDLNANIMVSVWPTVINDPMLKKYNLKDRKIGDKDCLDFYDIEVQQNYYKMLKDSMFNFGINSIWLDGSEPESLNGYEDHQTHVGKFNEVANIYSLLVSKSLFDGKQKDCPQERVLNLTRSAFTGQQRNGVVTWSGDVNATWRQFAEQISAGLNFTIAGIPYWSHDIGGFFRDSRSMNSVHDSQYTHPKFIELLTRWFQFGTFSPIFRIHGYKSQTEIWRYNEAFESTARKFIDLRYQLMPYIYTQAWNITNKGTLLMSPMSYYYPNDKNVWEIKDQVFFGESMLVAFVTEYRQREKTVYLPQSDDWYDFWTGKKMEKNGYVKVAAPLDQTPIFVKAGSIIPMGAKVQYATEPTTEPMRIQIYKGKNAEYTLYLDDDMTNEYQKGIYSEVKFSYDESNSTLEIEKGEDKFVNFKKSPMQFVIEVIGENKTKELTFKGKTMKVEL